MRELIEDALKNQSADYIEVRVEEKQSTRISYRGKNLEEIGRSTGIGGCVRAAYRGGWGFVSFNDLDELRDKVSLAISQARLVGKEKTHLADVDPVVRICESFSKSNPQLIPLQEKKSILDEYNNIMWKTADLQTSSIGYGDGHKKTFFANNQGTYIEQGRSDVNVGLSAMVRNGNEVQQATLSLGSYGDFNFVRDLHENVEEMALKAKSILEAPHVKGGSYTVILDPVLAGVFIHEAFGHLSEADHVYENPKLKEIMSLGRSFGNPILNVVDGASIPGLRGSYQYDDEGVAGSRTPLIKEGVLVGRLHSRETAARMGEKPTGNARAVSYAFPPIVRMTNTIIEPGTTKFEDMLSGIKEGVYAKNWYGGMTSMEMFTFSAGEAYMIRDGKIGDMIRPVQLSGNVFETLANIESIGNDLDINQGGGCGKGGQFPLPVSNGSPHIRIKNCLIGGR